MTKALHAPPRDFSLRTHRVLKFTGASSHHLGGFFVLAQSGDEILSQNGVDFILSHGYEISYGSRGLTAPPRDFNLIMRST